MQVGCLGDIAFEVSDSVVKTINNVTMSGSANIQSHARHLNTSLAEFVGIDPENIKFTITLSKYLGVDVSTEIDKILSYEKSGKILKFVIGTKTYGLYRWLIKKHNISMKHYDKQGNLASADVDITLTEYVKG